MKQVEDRKKKLGETVEEDSDEKLIMLDEICISEMK